MRFQELIVISKNLLKRIEDLEREVIEVKKEIVYGKSSLDFNLCPKCGDEENSTPKENEEGEFLECLGCGHTYDEKGRHVDDVKEEYQSKQEIDDIKGDMKYHEMKDEGLI